jgi:hypothetical protein
MLFYLCEQGASSMRMLIDAEWVQADGRADEIRDKATGELIDGDTKMSGNALHETLLDMTEQKSLLMCRVFPA